MTFRTFYVKIIEKQQILGNLLCKYIALKPYPGDRRIKLAIISD